MKSSTAILLAAIALAAALSAHAEGTLRICLDETTPYVVHRGNEDGGFDVVVAEAIAKRLGRTLQVQWFESEVDFDADPFTQQNALMADGHCQAIGGYLLYRDALGKPGAATARLPSYEGMKTGDRRRHVALGTMIPSRAYHYAPLTVVLGPKVADRKIGSIADLEGMALGAETSTVADAILMTYAGGKFVKQVTHLVPGRNELLPRLEKGEYDAVLLPLSRFDAYRTGHPDTKLKASGFYHRIGFNMGFAALSTEKDLVEQMNAAIGDMLANGEFAALAQATGITFVAPRQPDVLEPTSVLEFYRD